MSETDENEYEIDAPIQDQLRLYDTGGGYLVFRFQTEYDSHFRRSFLVNHELVGVTEVEDRELVLQSLYEFGLTHLGGRDSLEEHLLIDTLPLR